MKQTTGVFAVLTAALFLGSTLGVGCGDDTTTTGGAGTGGAAGSGGSTTGKSGSAGSGGTTTGTAGTGGAAGGDAGGKAGSSGSAGEAGTDAPTTIMCGTKTCGAAAGFPACCPMGENNACGGQLPANFGGQCITTTAGAVDAACPAITTAAGSLPGCCRPSGMCGANVGALAPGLGCADPILVGGAAAGPCGGDAAPPPVDAPSGDAPSGDAPKVDAPSGDAPAGDAPSGDAPAGDAPSGDAPSGDVVVDATADSAG